MSRSLPAITVRTVYNQDDCTYFIKGRQIRKFLSQIPPFIEIVEETEFQAAFEKWDCWEGYGKVVRAGHDPDKHFVEGRCMVVKCFKGDWLSVTLRKNKKGDETTPPNIKKVVPPKKKPESFYPLPEDVRAPKTGFAISLRKLIASVCGELFPDKYSCSHLTGLIIVSGSTKSGKSQVTRGIIRHLLTNTLQSDRAPHLVTLEDPIEKQFAKSPEEAAGWGVDYTPRLLGRVAGDNKSSAVLDCRSIREGLRNALRMSPKVLYVGETRDPVDWAELIHFAGTGHLVITTAHAGSVLETLSNILHAVGVKTPIERGAVAEKIIATIHLKNIPIDCVGKTQYSALLPQIWRRTESSVACLVADGLSSIQPSRVQFPAPSRIGCFSRSSFFTKQNFAPGLPLDSGAQTQTVLRILADEIRQI